MSQLSQLTGSSNATAFPGHEVSEPRVCDIADAEEECAASHIRTVARATRGMPLDVRDLLLNRVADNLRLTPICYGMPSFNEWALSRSALPYLAWVSLKRKSPKLEYMQAATMVADATKEQCEAIWDAWGFKKSPRGDAAAKKKDDSLQNPPTGNQYSEASAQAQADPVLPHPGLEISQSPSSL